MRGKRNRSESDFTGNIMHVTSIEKLNRKNYWTRAFNCHSSFWLLASFDRQWTIRFENCQTRSAACIFYPRVRSVRRISVWMGPRWSIRCRAGGGGLGGGWGERERRTISQTSIEQVWRRSRNFGRVQYFRIRGAPGFHATLCHAMPRRATASTNLYTWFVASPARGPLAPAGWTR